MIPMRIKYRDFLWKQLEGLEIMSLYYLVRNVKPPNNQFCFPQFFPRNFLSLTSLKRKQTFHWSKSQKKPVWTKKSLLSFSTDKTEKNSWKKLGKTRMVVWWFDVTNKILNYLSIFAVKVMVLFAYNWYFVTKIVLPYSEKKLF